MLKVFEMFAGYGGASFALKKAEIEYEVVGYSEIDKYAIECYINNHIMPKVLLQKIEAKKGYVEADVLIPKIKNYGDATKINPNELPNFDLFTGGTPCQDFSIAGKGKGAFNEDGTLTRSGLLFTFVEILKIKKPKYFLWENVKGVLTKKHQDTFLIFLKMLIDIGYEIDFRLFNSKEHGIPQNRERVFVYGRLKND